MFTPDLSIYQLGPGLIGLDTPLVMAAMGVSDEGENILLRRHRHPMCTEDGDSVEEMRTLRELLVVPHLNSTSLDTPTTTMDSVHWTLYQRNIAQ